MILIDYPDRDALAIGVANVLAGKLEAALLSHDRVAFAVPGGTTPGPVFDDLSATHLDWSRVLVLPTDERWVPETDARSNARLIRERLLVRHAAAATFLPLYAPADRPEDILAELETQIVPVLPLSVLLLGMGADMHTASLFPGTPGLANALADDAPILTVQRPESQSEARVSLTARVLSGALDRHLIITGADKREALEQARQRPAEEAPVRAVLGGMTVHWAE